MKSTEKIEDPLPDTLLVQPPNIKGSLFNLPGTEPPLSLCYLASALESRGYPCEIVDLTLEGHPESALDKKLRQMQPRIIGITSYTTNIGIAASIADRAKHLNPAVKTIIGGFHASALPGECLEEFPAFDFVVFEEGEVTICELVDRISSGAGIDGLLGAGGRENGHVKLNPPRQLIENLDSLPFPARRKTLIHSYVPDPGNFFTLPHTGLLFSRGCPMKCAFCSKSVFGDTIRYRTAENMVFEMESCIEAFGIRDFRFFDEGPTLRPRKMRELCELILARIPGVHWNCFSRIDSMNRSLLELMKRSGCYHITYGVESGVELTLRRIDKALDLDRAIRICRETRLMGIECKANFILALPGESLSDIRRTVAFSKELSPDMVTFNLFKPLPGSRLYEELKNREALLNSPWEDYFTTTERSVTVTAIPPGALKWELKRAWFSFYFRPAYLIQRLQRFIRSPFREAQTSFAGVKVLLLNIFK